ncbi:12291_t:CDS:1, partial [Gigaspora rosea]
TIEFFIRSLSFMDNIKKESLSTSFYEEVVDLTIDSSSERE